MKGFLPLFQCLAQRYELSETKAYYEEKINSMTRKHSILKKRAEEARSEWERREVNLLLSSAGKEQALLDRRESAEREFREYDEKYRDLHDKLKALNAKMDALSQGGTGETEEPIPEPEEAPEPDAAKEPETVPSEAPEKAAAGAAPGQQA